MDYQVKSKEELIAELKELQQNYDSLKAIYDIDITRRKQAEGALQESKNSRFRKIVEQAPIAMAIVSMDSIIEFINHKAVKVFGYLPTDIPTMERWWEQAYPDEDYRKEVVTEWTGRIQQAIIENTEIHGNEYRVTCKDGAVKTIFISGVIVSDKIFVLFDDVTIRKQAEEALKKSEERYRRLVETTDTGYVIIDSKGMVLDANPEYVRLSGHSQLSEILGKSVAEWTADEVKEINPQAVSKCIKNGFIRNLEITYVDKTGKRTPVEINATVTEMEGIQKILTLCRDITARKKAEEVQKQTASLLRATLESTADGILVVDLSGKVLIFNNKFKELWHIPHQVLDTGDDHHLISFILDQLKDPEKFLAKVKELYAHPDQESSDTIEFKDGKVFERYSQPQIIGDEIAGRVWSFRDITERKQAEFILKEKNYKIETQNKEYLQLNRELTQINEELQVAKAKAEESDRLKTAFLQNMSHEIRTPMNAIMGFSSLLVENYRNKPKLKEFSDIIYQSCNDLLEIINDLLDISKIESGQLQVNSEECSLDVLFTELSSFFKEHQKRIGKEQITLSLTALCDPSEKTIVTDILKLKQIFINLIGNAFKFTDTGKIEGGCKYDADHNLVFFVSDTGIGIPPDKHDIIFDRFAQVGHGKNQSFRGTGLGLSIVKGLIGILGGKIWLESELEKGTTFYFSFPYKIAPSAEREQDLTEKNQKYQFAGKTILVVEDDLYNSVYIKAILSDTGLNIIHTQYGHEAIRIATSQSPDLVLMDIRLPDINGYEATRQIKQLRPDLRIIAQTAYAAHDDKQKAFDAGCNDYISKPLKRNLLLSMINKHLLHTES